MKQQNILKNVGVDLVIKRRGFKRRKSIVSTLLIGLMAFNVSGIAAASEVITTSDIRPLQSTGVQERITELYAERGVVLAQKKEGYLEEYDRLGKELEFFGVDFLSPNEVDSKMEIAMKTYEGPTPKVIRPPNGKYIWSSYRDDWVKNGVTYEVEHLTAEPSANSNILKGTQARVIQATINLEAATTNLISATIKAGASEINTPTSVIITVYDAVKGFVSDVNFGRKTIIPDITVNYTVSWFQNIDFMYVKKLGESDDKQVLTFMSSAVSGETTWVTPEFKYKVNGAVKSVKNLVDSRRMEYYYPGAHRNGSMAVAALFNPSAPRHAYVTYAEIIGAGGKSVGLIPVATPASPVVMP